MGIASGSSCLSRLLLARMGRVQKVRGQPAKKTTMPLPQPTAAWPMTWTRATLQISVLRRRLRASSTPISFATLLHCCLCFPPASLNYRHSLLARKSSFFFFFPSSSSFLQQYRSLVTGCRLPLPAMKITFRVRQNSPKRLRASTPCPSVDSTSFDDQTHQACHANTVSHF